MVHWWMSANPDRKNVSGSKLCRRDGGILAKSDDIWLSGRHVADMSATFSAKIARLDNASWLFEKIIARLDELSFKLSLFY